MEKLKKKIIMVVSYVGATTPKDLIQALDEVSLGGITEVVGFRSTRKAKKEIFDGNIIPSLIVSGFYFLPAEGGIEGGIEFAEKIQKKTEDVPVVFYSDFTQPMLSASGESTAQQDYIEVRNRLEEMGAPIIDKSKGIGPLANFVKEKLNL